MRSRLRAGRAAAKALACRVFVSFAILAGTSLFAQAVDSPSLANAVQLYEDAAYGEALRVLDGLDADAVSPEQRPVVLQYRALCFIALERRMDAAAAIEALIAGYPDYAPGPDLPPRVQRLFDETRARVLPGIMRERYAAARAVYDAGEYTEAANQFDALVTFAVRHGSILPDLTELARGFRDLSRERAEEVVRSAGESLAPAVDGSTAAAVTPPGVIEQRMPAWPARVALTGHHVGLLEIIIGTDGTVARAAMREPVHPVYDELLVTAARQWRYTPAMQHGRPAVYVKQFRIDVGK